MRPTGGSLVITLPDWLPDVITSAPQPFDTVERRMQLAIALSRRNVERGGGPFGAAVFAGNELISVGVNRVLDSGYSIAHAEIVALMTAQRALRSEAPTLGTPTPAPAMQVAESITHAATPIGPLTLVTSTEPCCQCFGALIWSGVEHLVCGATTADAEAIGFDEGPKPPAWPDVLRARGISVEQQVLREEARAVLDDYARRGGAIYGLRHPSVP